jgi:D-arabinose 1-dehydrogenase-like Zn-dependent alcohol dehydrogenase
MIEVDDAAQMTAAVLTAVGRIESRRVPIPEPGEGELLVRVAATGVCGSDLATYRGRHPYKKPPVTLGHELCGVVVRTGPRVTGFVRRVRAVPRQTPAPVP